MWPGPSAWRSSATAKDARALLLEYQGTLRDAGMREDAVFRRVSEAIDGITGG
ncbi:MAG: hypothetical protein U5R14_00715 [Gemmatimonadota bacterium]|nr:hypothetical protein [Gemmatimonadota bacterium]